MWEPRFSVNGMLMQFLWTGAFVLIALGWILDIGALGQVGMVCSAIAATMTVIQDNRRTRQLIRRMTGRVLDKRT